MRAAWIQNADPWDFLPGDVYKRQPLKCPIFTYTIKDKKGTDLSGTNTMYEGADVKPVNEGDIYDVRCV